MLECCWEVWTAPAFSVVPGRRVWTWQEVTNAYLWAHSSPKPWQETGQVRLRAGTVAVIRLREMSHTSDVAAGHNLSSSTLTHLLSLLNVTQGSQWKVTALSVFSSAFAVLSWMDPSSEAVNNLRVRVREGRARGVPCCQESCLWSLLCWFHRSSHPTLLIAGACGKSPWLQIAWHQNCYFSQQLTWNELATESPYCGNHEVTSWWKDSWM